MHRSKCNGRHDDRQHDTWADTAGRLWREVECDGCGRLQREIAQ